MAQTLVAPSISDNLWYTAASGYTIKGINTAMIDLLVNLNHNWNRLAVCANFGGGGNPGGIVLTDINSGYTLSVAYPVTILGPTIASCPDVILGNNTGSANPGSDLIMAVVYINNSGNIETDYFNISYALPYTGTFTVSYNSASIITPLLGTTAQSVHIDVVAEYGNTSLTGLPLCDAYFITYDLSDFNVYAAFGSLSGYGLVSSVYDISTSSGTNVFGKSPDVAGIQYQVGASVNYKALITYLDQQYDKVFYATLDAGPSGTGPNVFSVPVQYDMDSHSGIGAPRIDAIDDYTINNTLGQANFQIVSTNSFHNEVRNYDDILGAGYYYASSSVIDLSSIGYTSSPKNHLPAVAFGPYNTTTSIYMYMVTEIANDPGYSPGDFVMMNPIDYTFNTLALDPSSSLSYFLVNKNYPEDIASCSYANSVSTPCNNVSDASIVAWARHNPASGFDEIDYKFSFFTIILPVLQGLLTAQQVKQM